jgi:HTH-type transcriptional regulator/antitoxin HigA
MNAEPPPTIGQILREQLEQRSWSQSMLARFLDRNVQHINLIVNGRKSITVEAATELAAAFGNTAGFWLAAQASHELWELYNDPAHAGKLEEIKLRALRGDY